MKTWVVRAAVGVLRWLGKDVKTGEQAIEQVRELVAELVRLRQEAEHAKTAVKVAETMLKEREVRVVFQARIQDRAKRAEVLKTLKACPETQALLDALDEAWLAEVNTMTHPQMEDRARQWAAGRAEAYVMVKSWVQG